MKLKPLNVALVTAGVLAVGTAGAFSLKPGWLDKPADAAKHEAGFPFYKLAT